MPIRMTTPLSDIGDFIENRLDEMSEVILERLCYIGEICLREARTNGSYGNITGNLRSSIGYAVVYNGEVYSKGAAKQFIGGSDGVSQGQTYLDSKIKDYADKKGMFLIVTAGMNYAEYVEAKGYNVLTSAELKAEDQAKRLLKKLGIE